MFFVFFVVSLFLSACQARGPLVGRWCTDPPSSLLYEYRADGSVHLFIESGEYHVFRYQLPDDHTLRLFDGMGRMLTYNYALEDGSVTLFDPTNPTVPTDHLTPPAADGRCQ